MKRKRLIYLGSALLVLAILVAGAFYVLNQKKSETNIEDASLQDEASSYVTYIDDTDALAKLSPSDQIDQLMRKEQKLRNETNTNDALGILDKIETTLPIEGWEIAIYAERIRIYKVTGDTAKLDEYSEKLRQYLIKNGNIGENDPLPDLDSGIEGQQ